MMEWIPVVILVAVLVLIIAADLLPKIKRYKLQSPIKKVELKKRPVRRKMKKNKQVWIRIK